MSFSTQASDFQQVFASGNVANNNRILKPGVLDGRIIAPCKSTRWLTDMQIRKINIIALTIVLSIAPILVGVLTGGVGAVACGLMFGMSGVMAGLILFKEKWPSADFQTSEGAEKILNDLRTNSLSGLHANYNFSDLSNYGYITKEDANIMQRLYNQMPSYETVKDGDRINHWASYCVNKVNCVHERRERIEHEFNALRGRPSFAVWK